jgi:serine/threonine protein kinase
MDYIGQKIEKYLVKRLIGEGGMASVYEAEHEVLGTKAAIKILNPVLTANADIRERFMNEAKMMASFQHTNITKIIDFEETDKFLAIIMEYLEGQDLSELIDSGAKLSDKEISDIFEQTLSAFQYAHEKGVIHRDIKPSNIYILPNGKVKVLDFGIAKLFGQGNEKTQAGTQMGTPIYMSPEQVKADKSIDHRSDIYSLGVTLYFALNGKSPYDSDGASQFDIFNKIVYEPLPELAGESPLIALVKKACQKDRDQRYQSCEEWLEDLRALQTGSSLADVQPPVKPKELVHEKTKVEEPNQLVGKVEIKNTNNQNTVNVIPQSSGAALTSLITGIIGLFLSWFPFLGFFLGLISVILGAVGQKDKQKLPSTNKSSGIAGIVLGSITMIIGIIFIIIFFIGIAAANEVNNLDESNNATVATQTEYSASNNMIESNSQDTNLRKTHEENKTEPTLINNKEKKEISSKEFNYTVLHECMSAFDSFYIDGREFNKNEIKITSGNHRCEIIFRDPAEMTVDRISSITHYFPQKDCVVNLTEKICN